MSLANHSATFAIAAIHAIGPSLAATTALSSSGCSSTPNAPGMVVVASSGTSSSPGSMLVAFPKSACTGTDSAVFIDEKGGFIGAVAPGTATYVAFPPGASRLFVVSSRDVTAARGTWFRRHVVRAPGERVDHGIVVEVPRIDTKNCYRHAVPKPEIVTYQEARHASLELMWLDVRADEGATWLTEHSARVTELLGLPPAADPPGAPPASTFPPGTPMAPATSSPP